jgi:hypothetical protein
MFIFVCLWLVFVFMLFVWFLLSLIYDDVLFCFCVLFCLWCIRDAGLSKWYLFVIWRMFFLLELFVCSYFHFSFPFFVLTQLTQLAQRNDLIFRVDTRCLLITLGLIFDWYLLLRPFSVQEVWFVLLFRFKCYLKSCLSSFVCDWYLFSCYCMVFVEFNLWWCSVLLFVLFFLCCFLCICDAGLSEW